MVLHRFDLAFATELRKLGRKRAPVDTQEIGKRLTVKRNVELLRLLTLRKNPQEQQQASADRPLRQDTKLPLDLEGHLAHHRQEIMQKMEMRWADLSTRAQDAVRAEEKDDRLADGAHADAHRLRIAEDIGHAERTVLGNRLEDGARAVKLLARELHRSRRNDANARAGIRLAHKRLLVLQPQFPHVHAFADLAKARLVEVLQEPAGTRKDDLRTFLHFFCGY